MRFRRNQGDPFSPMRSLLLRVVALIPVSGCTPAGEAPLAPDNPSSPRVAEITIRPEPLIGRGEPEEPTSTRIADIARDYKQLRSMTKEPVFVDPGLARLCIGATQRQVEEARKRSGPHAATRPSPFI